MCRFLSIIFLFYFSYSNGQSQNLVKEPSNSWKIAEKELPIPMAASVELQKILANKLAPDIVQSKQFKLEGDEAWNNIIAYIDGNSAKEIEMLSKQFSVSVRKDEIEGVVVRYFTPPSVAPQHKNRLFIHIHGGAYVFGSGEAGTAEAILIAARAKIPVISIDYRMPPKHPFPAAIDDVVKVYQHLLSKHLPKHLAIGGTSTGGGLTLASIFEFKKLSLDLPSVVFAGTPWSDLTKTGDTQFTNEGIDHILVSYDGLLKNAANLYASGKDLKNPLISPVYGNFKSFPPTYLVTGTRDLFLSDVVRTHRKLKLAGVIAELNVYEGMSHGDYLLSPNTPESIQVYEELGDFLIQHFQE